MFSMLKDRHQATITKTLKYVMMQYAGGAVGCGTALQVGRSWVRFPIMSLEFFVDIILPVAV